MTSLPRLVTIPISHYGERARWALDHAEVDYQETHHIQMFSWFAAYWHGRKKTLPVLVTDSSVLNDSAAIVRYAAERAARPLYPADTAERAAIERFEDDLSTGFAVETRRWAYDWFFEIFEASMPYNAGRAPAPEVIAMTLLRLPAEAFARRYLQVNREALERARGEVERTFDAIGERLSDGRPYLFGETFTAADLAFAAFAAPCLDPDLYPVPLPGPDALPVDAGAAIRSMRRHPAGAFALRLYDERPKPRGRYARDLWIHSHPPRIPLQEDRSR
jgi:glutathione S-transferase